MTLGEARIIVTELTKSPSLLRHMRSIELVMKSYVEKSDTPSFIKPLLPYCIYFCNQLVICP